MAADLCVALPQWRVPTLARWPGVRSHSYVLDKERLKNGALFNEAYFDDLLSEIRETRASERRCYQKLSGILMTMQAWAGKLNAFLQFNERDILDHPGKVSQEVANVFAEGEFEKCRVVQDRLFESDFDRHVKKALGGGKDQP